MKWKKRCTLKSEKGFTLIEMVIATALVSIFFTMVAFIVPVWYKAYGRILNVNYARQIANSTIGGIEEQIRFANQIEVVTEEDGVQRITGTIDGHQFYIPMKGTGTGEENPPLIDGLVYDEDFFMNNDMKLSFELSADKKYCTVTVEISRDGEKVLEKVRAVSLVGEND